MKSKCKDTHEVIIMETVTAMENQAANTSLVSTAHGIHKASLLPVFAVLRRCSSVSPAAVGRTVGRTQERRLLRGILL